MTKINRILFLLVCGLFLAVSVQPAWAEYETVCRSANEGCPEGWTEASGTAGGIIGAFQCDYYCWKCDDASDCEATRGVMKGCTPLQVKLRESKDCIFCPLFQSLYTAVQTMSRQAFDTTKDAIRKVMSLGFALYIAFSVLGHVSSMTKQDAPKFLTGLLVSTCKFLVAFLLLMNKDTIYYYVINPLLSTALDFGGAMLFTAGDAIKTCKTDTAGLSGTGDKVLPNELYVTMECFIKGVQAEIAFAQAAGSSIMCVGRNEASGAFGIWDFSMVFSGLAIYLCALLLSFAFGFYLIDSVVMLGVLGALMTFFIACWPFKMTGGYTGKGFNMFMNIFFTFIFMGIVVSINTQLIKASLSTGGLENIEDVLSGGNIRDSKQILDINGAGFLIILCCCFFGFKFSAKTAQLAGSMAGGGGIDIGAKLGGLLTSGAVNSAMRVGKSATAPITAKAKQAGNAVLNGTATALAHPFKSARKLGGVVNKKFGQAQKAAGVTQGIAGNLAMAAGIKGGEDLIKKGEGLYNKGQARTERGQARIDKENAGIYGSQNTAENPNDNGSNQNTGGNGTDTADSNTAQRVAQLEQQIAQLEQQLAALEQDRNATEAQKTELANKLAQARQELGNEQARLETETQSSRGSGSVGDSTGGGRQYDAGDYVDAQEAQSSRQVMTQAMNDYSEAKSENLQDMAEWQRALAAQDAANEQLQQALAQAQSAAGTPQEADARKNAETAQQTFEQSVKNAAAQRSKVTTSRGKMSQAAVSYHISKSKVEANGKGERFNEQKARDYAQANIDKVMAQIDKIAAAGPRS